MDPLDTTSVLGMIEAQDSAAKSAFLSSMGSTYTTGYTNPQSYGINLVHAGKPVAGGLFNLAMSAAPRQRAEAGFTPRREIMDRDVNTPLRTFYFGGGGGTTELARSSAMTAADMVGTGAPRGYFVMTDAQRAKGFMGDRAMRGALYGIQARELDDGSFDIFATALGVKRRFSKFSKGYKAHAAQSIQLAKANRFHVNLNAEDAANFLESFSTVNRGNITSGGTRVQMGILAHQRALDSLRILEDPDKFGQLVNERHVNLRQGERGSIMGGGLHTAISPRARALRDRAIDPLIRHAAMGKAIHHAFESQIAHYAKQHNLSGENLQSFRQQAWKMFMNPVLRASRMQVNWPSNPALNMMGADVIRGSALTGSGMAGLLYEHAVESGLGKRVHGRFKPSGGFQKTLEGMAGSRNQYIINQLERLDTLELQSSNRWGQLKLGGQALSAKRVESFRRLQKRMDHMLANTGQHKYDIHYEFQHAEPKFGLGYGVWINIVKKGEKSIHAGQPDAVQSFLPIEDIYGRFTTSTNARMQGRWTAISDRVLGRAQLAPWMNDTSIISQGFVHAKGTSFGPKGAGVKIYSATQAFVAGFDSQFGKILSGLRSGDLGLAQRALSSAVGLATISNIGAAVGDAGRLQGWMQRRIINMPDIAVQDPMNFMGLKKSRVDREKWLRMFFHGDTSQLSSKGSKTYVDAADKARTYYGHVAERIRSMSGDDEDKAWNLVGNNMGYEAKHTFDERQRLVRMIPGMYPVSDQAPDENFLAQEVIEKAFPLGTSAVRPVQEFNAVSLKRSADVVANTPFMVNEGYEGLMSNEFTRFGRTGFVIAGQIEGQEGVLDAEAAMQAVGNWEQQGIIHKRSQEKLFGKGANALNQKAFADMSKMTLQVAGDGNKMDWDDPIDLLTGVPFEKTIKKHESLTTLQRGMINRVLADPGQSAEELSTTREALQRLLGNVEINQTINGMFTAKLKDGYTAPTIDTITSMINEVNAVRPLDRQINIYRTMNVTLADGITKMKLNIADILLPIRIINSKGWDSKFSPRELLYRKEPNVLAKRARAGSIGAIDLMRMKSEGLGSMARNVIVSAWGNKLNNGKLWSAIQMMGAYRGMQGIREDVVQALNPTKVTLEELAAARAGRAPAGGMTREQYDARYGSGFREAELGNGSSIFIPDEVPDAMGKAYRPSSAQAALDRAFESYNQGKELEFNDRINRYKSVVESELKGKSGLISDAFKRMELSGQGVIKGPLAQSMWVVGEGAQEPFSIKVGPELARSIGAIGGGEGIVGAYRKRVEERGYYWGTIHRDPQVILGRMGAKVIIDPSIKGMGMYVHESLREALIGDSDGDKVRSFLGGPLEHAQISQQTLDFIEAEFEKQNLRKTETWRLAQSMKAQRRGKMITNLADGTEYIKSFMKNPTHFMVNSPFRTSEERLEALSALAEQRRVAEANGIMGALVDPLQIHFMNKMVEADIAEDISARNKYQQLYDAFGAMREEVLKTKAGKEFDPYKIDVQVRGVEPAVETHMSKTHDAIVVGQQDWNDLSNPGDWNTMMQKQFIDPALEPGPDGLPKDPAKAARFALARDFVNEQRQANGIRWYGDMIKDRGIVGDMMSETPNPEKFSKGMNALVGWVMGYKVDTSARGLGGPVETGLQQMTDYTNSSAPIPPAVQGAPVSELAPEVTEHMIDKTLGMTEAETSAKMSLKQTLSSTFSKMKNPWVLGGLGAAGLAGLGMTFAMGGTDRANAKYDDEPMASDSPRYQPPTRVMSNEEGQSGQAYNVRVTAKGSDVQPDDFGPAIGGSLGAQVNVNVRDNRKNLRDQQQKNTIQQLKGR